jgi:hypothetical protein
MSTSKVKEIEMDAEVLDTEDESLLEFKASLGDPSEFQILLQRRLTKRKKAKAIQCQRLAQSWYD